MGAEGGGDLPASEAITKLWKVSIRAPVRGRPRLRRCQLGVKIVLTLVESSSELP